VVVIGLVAMISAGAYVTLRGHNSGATAAEARASLVQLLKLQTATPDVPNANPQTLAALDPNRSYQTAPSTTPSTVSVTVDGSVLAGAVFDGVDCWMLIRDFGATTVAEQQIWAVEKNSTNCAATRALTVASPDSSGERGGSVRSPRII
jgi:hypothetical protein